MTTQPIFMPSATPLALHSAIHEPLSFAMPALACDCHTHVFGPADQFPFATDRQYTADDASVAELLALQAHLGLDRVVIVHPSPYGADNACTVNALHQLGDRARGVAVIDAATTDAELHAMHEAGVRGVRLNLETAGVSDPLRVAEQLRWASARVSPLGWHLQIYTQLSVVLSLQDEIAALPIPLVVDHFCRTPAALGVDQPGFDVLLNLVRADKVWVKLSAPHRISNLPDCEDVRPLVQALIMANPNRLLWGSDWPHPGAKSGRPRRVDEIETFNPINDGRALNRLNEWVGDVATLHKILVDNPATLYGFNPQESRTCSLRGAS